MDVLTLKASRGLSEIQIELGVLCYMWQAYPSYRCWDLMLRK